MTNTSHQEFAEFVSNMRDSIKWNYRELGDALGVTDRTIFNWEKGESLSRRNLDDLTSNIRLIVRNEIVKQREINKLSQTFKTKYTFKGGKLVV